MFENYHEFRYKNATCEVSFDGVWTVMRVYSKDRGSGQGTALLRLVTEWADENGHDLYLLARAYGGPVQTMLDNKQLIQFYEKFGFEVDEEQAPELGARMRRECL